MKKLLVVFSLILTLILNKNISCASNTDISNTDELAKKIITSHVSDDIFSQHSDSEEDVANTSESTTGFEPTQNNLFDPKTSTLLLNKQNLDDKQMLHLSINLIMSDSRIHDGRVVKHYEFRDNKFGDPGACHLATGMCLNYKLLSLDVRGNNISDVGFSALGASVIRLSKFKSLKYSGTPYNEVLLQETFKYCTYSIHNLDGNDHEIIFTKLPCAEDYENDNTSRGSDNDSDISDGDIAQDRN